MHKIRRLLWLLSFWLVVLYTQPVAAQVAAGAPRAESRPSSAPDYVFVSPNTRTALSVKRAINGLHAQEETNLIFAARQIACRLNLTPVVVKAIGSWTDGAENSTIIRLKTDEPSLRYIASWLGRRARQKEVLYFYGESGGRARMYIIKASAGRQSLSGISKSLDGLGVPNRTLVPGLRRVLVYVVDTDGNLAARVALAARRLHARYSSIQGNAGFLGDDTDANKSEQVYSRTIAEYESAHPVQNRRCQGFANKSRSVTPQPPVRRRRLRSR